MYINAKVAKAQRTRSVIGLLMSRNYTSCFVNILYSQRLCVLCVEVISQMYARIGSLDEAKRNPGPIS